MSQFSKKMQGVATKLLKKYGSTAALVVKGGRVFDTGPDKFVTLPDSETPLTGAPVAVNAALVNGTSIQSGDMMLICDESVIPKLADKVRFGGYLWSIVAIPKSLVNDDDIVYKIQIRK